MVINPGTMTQLLWFNWTNAHSVEPSIIKCNITSGRFYNVLPKDPKPHVITPHHRTWTETSGRAGSPLHTTQHRCPQERATPSSPTLFPLPSDLPHNSVSTLWAVWKSKHSLSFPSPPGITAELKVMDKLWIFFSNEWKSSWCRDFQNSITPNMGLFFFFFFPMKTKLWPI